MQLEEFPDATVMAFGAILKACPGANLTNSQTDFNLDETPMYLHRPPGINAVLSDNAILSKLYLDKFEDTTRELEQEIVEQMKKDGTFNNTRPHPINQWDMWDIFEIEDEFGIASLASSRVLCIDNYSHYDYVIPKNT